MTQHNHPGSHPLQIYWQVLAWIMIALTFGLLLWLLSSMLLPFVIALILAYFLDPVVTWLSKLGLARALAAMVVAVLTFGTLLGFVAMLVPLVISEGAALVDSIPDSFEALEDLAEDAIPAPLEDQIGGLGEGASRLTDTLRETFQGLSARMVEGAAGLISVVMFWIVMPVVTVYLMIDWPRLIRSVDDLLPRPHVQTLRGLAADIDAALSGYVRGQSLVCAILISYYSVALTLVGLPFGFAVGVVTGAVSFIPYVGMFIGTTLGMGVAVWQFWGDPVWIGAVAAIYALGLFAESEILVPRMVGSAVNLHPVWMIFAVIAFGTLFGLVGALIAIPLATIAGVTTRFLTQQYRNSTLYKGRLRP